MKEIEFIRQVRQLGNIPSLPLWAEGAADDVPEIQPEPESGILLTKAERDELFYAVPGPEKQGEWLERLCRAQLRKAIEDGERHGVGYILANAENLDSIRTVRHWWRQLRKEAGL